MFKKLIIAATWLALGVIVLGAYVRLSDAGLGCPDWPGCYGKLSPAHAAETIAQAEAAQPGGPVSAHKAWKEMTHRYFASLLGLLILVIGIMAWVKRDQLMQGIGLPFLLIVLVIFQGLLGMWTVTLLLKPVIVTLHLLGGMSTLALLVWLGQRQSRDIPQMRVQDAVRMKSWALTGLLVVFFQIALGGWVSANYAALACADFPTCKGAWVPSMDFTHAFHFTRELGKTAQGELLSLESLTAIHWMHRLGALITFIVISMLVYKMLRIPSLAQLGAVIWLVLLVQIGLGISNVLFSLPLLVAVAHNATAALLVTTLVMLNFRLSKTLRRN